MNTSSFYRTATAEVITLHSAMRNLAVYAFAKDHLREDSDFTGIVRDTTSLAQQNTARLTSEIDAIDVLHEKLWPELRHEDEEWPAYLDWEGQRIIRRIESQADECVDSINAIMEIVVAYSDLHPSNFEHLAQEYELEDKEEWVTALESSFERLLAVSVSSEASKLAEESPEAIRIYLKQCGTFLEKVENGLTMSTV